MTLEKRIDSFLASEKRWPIIVDFSNRKDMQMFIEHYSVGDNKILPAGEFCRQDGTMKIDELLNAIENNEDNAFIVNISGF